MSTPKDFRRSDYRASYLYLSAVSRVRHAAGRIRFLLPSSVCGSSLLGAARVKRRWREGVKVEATAYSRTRREHGTSVHSVDSIQNAFSLPASTLLRWLMAPRRPRDGRKRDEYDRPPNKQKCNVCVMGARPSVIGGSKPKLATPTVVSKIEQ